MNSTDVDAFHLVTDSHGAPAIRCEVMFKNADGGVDKLVMVMRVSAEPNPPSATKRIELFIGGFRGPGDWNKDEEISGVLFHIRRPAGIRALLRDLSLQFSAFADHEFLNPPEAEDAAS